MGSAAVTRSTVARRGGRALLAVLVLGVALAAGAATTTIYKWTDADGTVHLSTTKPPAGVKFETRTVASSTSPTTSGGARAGSGSARPPASTAHASERGEVLASLRNRECVIALEELDRLTSGDRPTSATEIKRLKQTADANCSRDPAHRREQEDMAAKLRVANGPECLKARNELADMQAKRVKATPEQLRAQQAFVDEHCIPPVQ
jgi:hypothetical protein